MFGIMDLFPLSAAAAGLVAAAIADLPRPDLPDLAALDRPVEGALVGQGLYASEDPIDRWGDPVRAEDVTLEPLGRVAEVVTAPDGTAQGLVVAVGGLWGLGAREVRVGLERVHLLAADAGGTRLVVDLSADGAAPEPG
jgi:hypothetical protein